MHVVLLYKGFDFNLLASEFCGRLFGGSIACVSVRERVSSVEGEVTRWSSLRRRGSAGMIE